MNPIADFLNGAGDAWWPLAVHVTWQASLVAAVVLSAVWVGRRWPSPLRYGLMLVALFKFVAPPFLALPAGAFSRLHLRQGMSPAEARVVSPFAEQPHQLGKSPSLPL